MTRHWKLKSVLVAGVAALATTAAEARENASAGLDVERPQANLASSEGAIIVAGNSS